MRSILRIWVHALLALAVQSWAADACTTGFLGGTTCGNTNCNYLVIECGGCTLSCNGLAECPSVGVWESNGRYYKSESLEISGCSVQYYGGCNHAARTCYYRQSTTTQITQCEADSVRYYSSCVSQANHFWDSDSCKCRERTEADSVFTVCTEDVRNGAPFYQIYVVNVHYKNGVLESACGVSPSLINGEGYKQYCALKRSGNGTCANAGVPNGPSEPKPCNGDCSQAGQEMVPTAECYAVVGYNCYLRDIRSGNTFRCECDGSCSKAMTDMLRPFENESNCRNPYNNPSSSPSSSDSGSSSPSSSPSSSDSGSSSPSSGTSGIDYTEQLNQLIANTQGIMNNTGDIGQWTQETMNNTIDINNKMTELGIDVGNIRDNTAATKENTYNIANQMNDWFNQFVNYVGNQNQNQHAINSSLDSIRNSNKSVNNHVQSMDGKLTQTNSLLDSLTKKEWGVSVNVAGDTNIINVTTDTSKAPAEIKGILDTFTGAFNDFVSMISGFLGGDTSGWNGDTTGWNAGIDSARKQLDSTLIKSDWVKSFGCDTTGGKKCDGAIIGSHGLDSATSHLRGGYRALGDSLKNGVIGDSLAVWGSKFTGNGVISGSGGNSCPSILSRSWHVTIGLTGFDITIGRYLCSPIFGNVTAWALCRLLLRASVALACMWFLFKCAVGLGEADDD